MISILGNERNRNSNVIWSKPSRTSMSQNLYIARKVTLLIIASYIIEVFAQRSTFKL